MDWGSVERRFGSGPGSGTLRNLRLLDRLATPEPDSAGVRPGSGLRGPSLSWPLRLVLAVALLQVPSAVVLALVAPRPSDGVPPLLVLATGLVFAACAGVLLRAGRADSRTRPLAGFFLAVTGATCQRFFPEPMTDPALVPTIRWISAFLPECFLPYFLWRFVEQFPRILHLARWSRAIRVMAQVSAAAGAVLFAVNTLARLGVQPVSWEWSDELLRSDTGPYWEILFVLALPAPLIGYLRSWEAGAEERQRLRYFLGGLALGVLPLFLVVLVEGLNEGVHRFLETGSNRERTSYLVYPALLTIPLTTGYAVAAQRLLTVRLILHRAARLALARGTLLALSAAPWLALGLHLWRHREEPLAATLAAAPAPGLLLAAALGLTLYLLRGPILGGLEQSLLGRRRAPGAVLASFHQGMSSARDLEELGALVRVHAADLLQAEAADLLVRRRRQDPCVAPGSELAGLAPGSSLLQLAEAAPEPFSLDPRDRDSLLPWLPEGERRWVQEGGIRLLVPLADPRGEGSGGVLCFGPARSGLAYSQEERGKAAALASATGLALERLAAREGRDPGPEGDDGPAGECRSCGRVSPDPAAACVCGGALAPAALPYVLAGKFQLEAILGEGGMGLVYRARDRSLDRPVALKTLPRLGSGSLVRLRGEARSMARFVHPGLALIFGAETWRGVPVLVVEYLAGGTLDQRLGQPWEPAAALELAVEVADALVALHGQGLLHRDVKPSNIGFTADGRTKLLDFGLARLVEEAGIEAGALSALADEAPAWAGTRLTRTDHIVGTPLYLSPEALGGAPPSPAQDLWALWLVLWELLAGHHPLRGLPLRPALDDLRKGRIPELATARPDCPGPLAEALARGLARAPASRFPSAEAVHGELLSLRSSLS